MNSQSESSNNSEQQPVASSTSAAPTSISVRLGHLLRSTRQNSNSDSNSLENTTPDQETVPNNNNNSNHRSGDSSFYEIFRLNSNPDILSRQSFGPSHRTSLRLPASLRSSSRGTHYLFLNKKI